MTSEHPIPPNVMQTAGQLGRPVRALTLKRAAALAELGTLGFWQAKAAAAISVQKCEAGRLAARYGFTYAPRPIAKKPYRATNRPVRSEFLKLIMQRYAEHVPPAKIAAETGKPIKTVMVCASQLGLTTGRSDTGWTRRGFMIPDHLMPRYRELRKLGMTFEECGFELGLIARPAARSLTIIERAST